MVEAAKNIVKDFKIGNTRVRISDDYCKDKTPEDVQRILERITRDALRAFNAAETAKKNAGNTNV